MECLTNMSLKKSFFWLTFWCLAGAVVLSALSFAGCIMLRRQFDPGQAQFILEEGSVFQTDVPKAQPDTPPAAPAFISLLEFLQIGLPVFFFLTALILSDFLFYRFKLKTPISILQQGAQHIIEGNLDFKINLVSQNHQTADHSGKQPSRTILSHRPAVVCSPDSAHGQGDELAQLCSAFETMRVQLKKNNQELWRQAEERKRLNAAFSHDLRNPVTVLKGTVKLLKQGIGGQSDLERMETYTDRLEQYVEAMSSIHRLEELPVRKTTISLRSLHQELAETASMLAPGLISVLPLSQGQTDTSIDLDRNLFLNVSENLIGNASRFARSSIRLSITLEEGALMLILQDDGPGYPPLLIKDGPKPFQKGTEDVSHFGMGLYICHILCDKHGGRLLLENTSEGARTTAEFLCS